MCFGEEFNTDQNTNETIKKYFLRNSLKNSKQELSDQLSDYNCIDDWTNSSNIDPEVLNIKSSKNEFSTSSFNLDNCDRIRRNYYRNFEDVDSHIIYYKHMKRSTHLSMNSLATIYRNKYSRINPIQVNSSLRTLADRLTKKTVNDYQHTRLSRIFSTDDFSKEETPVQQDIKVNDENDDSNDIYPFRDVVESKRAVKGKITRPRLSDKN